MSLGADTWLRLSSEQQAEARDALLLKGWARVRGPLSQGQAQSLHDELADMPWDFNSLINGRTWVAEPEKLAQIGEERIAAMAQIGAEDQFRWAHDNIMPNEDDGPRERRSMQLATLYKEWTTEDAVAIWNTIMPDRGISGIAIKASRFRPGHFLTPHDDADGEKRVVAIVLSLNPEWEPHWGGQLQLEDNQGALQVLSPEHNVLHMFTVPRRHFVSQVATYAPRGRIAISGWLTRD